MEIVTDATIPASTIPSANNAAPNRPINGCSACANSARLKVLGSHVVSEQWGCCNDSCDRSCRGQSSPYDRIDAAKVDVFRGESLVNRCALLKEKHPRGHSCANVSQHDDQSVLAQAARERLPGNECAADRVPIRVCKQGNGNENKIENGDSEQGSFPCPITVHYYSQTQEHKCTDQPQPMGVHRKIPGLPGWQ